MKNLKKLLFVAFLIVSTIKMNAQDEQHPWAVGLGINLVDVSQYGVSTLRDQLKDYANVTDISNLPVIPRAYVARYLKNGFSLDIAGAINAINRLPSVKVPEKSYYSLDLGLRYDLNTLFGETGWFDPYAKFAVGTFWVDRDVAAAISPSLGFNTWFSDSVGLNFETSYKSDALFGDSNLGETLYVTEGYHFQHSISLVIRFGDKDSDGDGVSDIKDLCPLIAGEKEFLGCPDSDGDGIIDSEDECPNLAGGSAINGCPDSDGDGVIDSEDACPELAGGAATNGCPDSDGDGVIDSEDACPELAGEVKYDGCPDSDKDGVIDSEDKCPDTFGSVENKGCPWPDSDKDGVTDNLDNCINEKGPKENNGCPVKLTEEAKKKLGAYAKTIQFNSGKSEFKPGVTNTLDGVVQVMKEFDSIRFDVEGHCDSSGNDARNLKLSQDRAQAVVDYFTSHGIEDWRLHAVGYGETKPIASNKTATGRALNRRVVLTAIESK